VRALLLLALLAPAASAFDKEGGAPSLSTAVIAAPVPSSATVSAAPFAAVVPAEAGVSAPPPSARTRLRFGRAQLFGSRSYVGSSNIVEANVSSWSVRTGLRDYTGAGSTGTYYTISGRAGWTDGSLSAGIIGEFTPRSAGYRSRAFGADLGWAWRPAGKIGAVKRVSLVGSVVRMSHSTDLPTKTNVPVVSSDIGQSDLAASAGVTVWNASLSAGFKKSVYNLDGADLTQSTSRVLTLTNFDPVVTGLPQDEWWLRASFENVRWGLTPSVAWTRTVYKVAQPPTSAGQAGLTEDFGRWSATAFYARLSESGRADSKYVGFGAYVKF
jgi:hypothetical protein